MTQNQTQAPTFSTLFNCMDGRTQDSAIAYAKQLFGTDTVDTITEPGMDGILAGQHSVLNDPDALEDATVWVRVKADISANGHGSKQALIVGHCGCAGNQVELDEHVMHVQKAMGAVRSWGLFEEVRGAVFDENWQIQEVSDGVPARSLTYTIE